MKVKHEEYLKKCGTYRAAAELAFLRSFYSSQERYDALMSSIYFDLETSREILEPLCPDEARLYTEWVHSHRNRILEIVRVLNVQSNERVIDIGCNIGTFVYHCSLKGKPPVGIDINVNSLKIAQRLLRNKGKNGYFLCGDATLLPFQRERFHKAVAADFYEHVDEREKKRITEEVYRVLKNKGIFVIHTDNLYRHKLILYIRRIVALIRLENPRNFSIPFHDTHIGVTGARKIVNILQQTGFKISKIVYLRGRFSIDKFLIHVPLVKNILASSYIIVGEK